MNRGHDFPPYISRPTTSPRYGDDSNPYPSSRQLGLDRWSSNRHGYSYGYGEGNPSPSLGNGELGLDNRSSIHRGYGDGNRFQYPRNGAFRLDHSWPSFEDHITRNGAPTEHRHFEERPAIRPFGQTSISPMVDHPPPLPRIQPQVIIIGNNGSRSPRFPFSSHRLTPRPLALTQEIMNTHTPNHLDIFENESKLTKEEQEQVLKKLKKEIYDPAPNYNKTMKFPPRKVSLYYRDLNRDLNYNVNKGHEEGKRCAICLEDFEARDEVMLTPCNHMFHEECIVPWVKNHGQCPICRFVFCERLRVNGSRLSRESGNRVTTLPVDHGLFEGELLSLIQAVNEAFPWGA